MSLRQSDFLCPSFTVRTLLIAVVLIRLALRFGLGLGEESGRGASGLCDPVMLLGDDLVSDPFAGNLRRVGAGKDGTKRGVGLGETEREKVGKDEVGDDDIGGFELVSGENDAVQLWFQRLCIRKSREQDLFQEGNSPAIAAVRVPSLEAIPALL